MAPPNQAFANLSQALLRPSVTTGPGAAPAEPGTGSFSQLSEALTKGGTKTQAPAKLTAATSLADIGGRIGKFFGLGKAGQVDPKTEVSKETIAGRQTAVGTVASAAASQALAVQATRQEQEERENAALDQVHQDFVNTEFIRRLKQTKRVKAEADQLFAALDLLERQAPAQVSGREQQVFLRDPITGGSI